MTFQLSKVLVLVSCMLASGDVTPEKAGASEPMNTATSSNQQLYLYRATQIAIRDGNVVASRPYSTLAPDDATYYALAFNSASVWADSLRKGGLKIDSTRTNFLSKTPQ